MSKINKIITARLPVLLCLILGMTGCNTGPQKTSRETIFDRIVTIPKELVLTIPYLPPLCDTIPGLKKGHVAVLEGSLYYEEEGSGIPLVLVNGGPGGTHHGFHPYFSQLSDIAHIIYYDQRGTGQSSQDSTGKTYTIRQAVEDLESLRKALKIDKWAVLGWSYGGFLAQCYALTYPERCTGLILVASQFGISEPATNRELVRSFFSPTEWAAIENVQKQANEDKLTTAAQVTYNKHMAGDWKRYSYYKPTTAESIRTALYAWGPAPGFEKLMHPQIYTFNLRGKFDDFEIPTLIIEAKWDLLWGNPDKIELMRKIHPHATVEIFEKSGHKIFADEPEKFFGLLKNFLEKLNKMPIVYHAGNRITWPEPPSELTRKLVMARASGNPGERERVMLESYEQALKEQNRERRVWFDISWLFIQSGKQYEKTLISLQHAEACCMAEDPAAWQAQGGAIKALQGVMLDLLGRRAEAVACYREALKLSGGRSETVFGQQIDTTWLENRLKTPFTFSAQPDKNNFNFK